jgi:hypothetical protein
MGAEVSLQGPRLAHSDLGVNPMNHHHFLRLLSVFLTSSFRLYARKTKTALTIEFGAGKRETAALNRTLPHVSSDPPPRPSPRALRERNPA